MIPYHGTPVGGTRKDVARFLRGRHGLVPFLRRDDMGAVAEFCSSFVFDNSAFSVWERDAVLDVEGFTRWVEEWCRHPGFDWALIPDTITGSEADNDALLRDWTLGAEIGVPVWHLHEGIGRLERLCKTFPVVALGSSGEWRTPGTPAWWSRMSEAMNAVCDEHGRPMAQLHGLRMLDPEIFSRLPLRSADSTNAAVNCGSLDRFGMYLPPTAAQRAEVIAERIEAHNSAPCWRALPIQQNIFADEVEAHHLAAIHLRRRPHVGPQRVEPAHSRAHLLRRNIGDRRAESSRHGVRPRSAAQPCRERAHVA